MAGKTKRLFTIGYEQTPPKAVLDELENAGVKLLVDVRAVVSSRRPGFPRTSSPPASTTRHFLYSHEGLARRRKAASPRAAATSRPWSASTQSTCKTPQAKEELDELSSLVMKSGPVCILCYERDHAHCHRKWIAEIIEARDSVKIENLLPPQL